MKYTRGEDLFGHDRERRCKKSQSFLYAKDFDTEKYYHYSELVARDNRNEAYYNELTELLLRHIYHGKYDGEYEGILDAYIETVRTQGINLYSFEAEQRDRLLAKRAFAHLLKGDLDVVFALLTRIHHPAFGYIQTIKDPSIYFLEIPGRELGEKAEPRNGYLVGLYSFFKWCGAHKVARYIEDTYWGGKVDFPIMLDIPFPEEKRYCAIEYIGGSVEKRLDVDFILSKIPNYQEKVKQVERFVDIL